MKAIGNLYGVILVFLLVLVGSVVISGIVAYEKGKEMCEPKIVEIQPTCPKVSCQTTFRCFGDELMNGCIDLINNAETISDLVGGK